MNNKTLLKKYLKKDNKISKFFSKILVCVIIILGVLIINKTNPEVKSFISNKVYNTNFNFSYFNSKISSLFKEKEKMVFMESFEYENVNNYLEGNVFTIKENTLIKSFEKGVVVFKGYKDNYGNTVIVQTSSGFDVWYSNLENINVDIYDYVSENSLIGDANNKVYIVIFKNNKYYTYEEYKNSFI